ncbi:MAG TPA: hypothetical protein PK677_15980, partial [Acidiphilium sp.]|nr:hypothetical protein [Acidiphilium sp.]
RDSTPEARFTRVQTAIDTDQDQGRQNRQVQGITDVEERIVIGVRNRAPGRLFWQDRGTA